LITLHINYIACNQTPPQGRKEPQSKADVAMILAQRQKYHARPSDG